MPLTRGQSIIHAMDKHEDPQESDESLVGEGIHMY